MATVLTAIIVVLVHYEINRKHLKTYYTNSSVRALGSFENSGGSQVVEEEDFINNNAKILSGGNCPLVPL